MAGSHGNFDEEVCEDRVGIEYSETSESRPTKADDNDNQEKQTEEPQVVSINGREINDRPAVMCAESSSQTTSLEGGDPQPLVVDAYTCNRHDIHQKSPVTNICEQSVQMPYQGIEVLVFVLEKRLSEDKALYKVYMIPKRNHKLREEICQQDLQSYKDRQLSFYMDNMEMKDFLTLHLESGQQITVCFKIENQQQENFVGQAEGCKQFDGLQIRSQSESRLPAKGAKATFYVQYRGTEGVPCQVQGKITLTIESCQAVVNGPAKRISLLFSISN